MKRKLSFIVSISARGRVALMLALLAASCAPKRLPSAALSPVPTCGAGSPEALAWAWHPDPSERPQLDRWCMGVGAPVLIDAPPAASGEVSRLLILSWNVHVGGGRLEELVTLIRQRSTTAPGNVGLVLLLQEAFRGGEGVPDRLYSTDAVPDAIRPNRPTPDIAEQARRLGMSLAYVPSMRNGPAIDVLEREDRGSAILSTEPLSDVKAVELPFGRQRRVAVMATVTPRGGQPLRVLSGHFDVARGTRRQAEYLARFLETAAATGPPIVVGLDTNAMFGSRDATVDSLRRVVPLETCGQGRTSAWIARVDFMFSSLPAAVERTCERFTDTFGSDHLPLLLTIDAWGDRRVGVETR